MALNKPALQNQIKTLLQDMMNREQASFDEFAERLATAVDTFVKSGTVSTTVTGTCAIPGVGAGTIAGNGTGAVS